MKNILLILTLFIISLSAQEKFLVFFKDKGITHEEFASSPLRFYKDVEKNLSQHTIERRKKVLGENYITFQDIPINPTYIKIISELDFEIDNKLKWFNAVSVYAAKDQIKKIERLDFVKKVEPVKIFRVQKGDKDKTKYEEQNSIALYNLDYGNSLPQSELHDIPVVQDAGFNGQNVIIGFLDSGFDWKTHPALKNLNVIYEYDYVFNDNETKDEAEDVIGQDYHGTAVFSICAGFDEGRLIGPAYGASYMLAKTEDIASETRVEEDNFAAAVEDLEEMGADIISASLGYSIFDSPQESYTYQDMDGKTTLVAQAYNFAFELGVVTIAAAGNEGNSTWRHIISPADAFDVIAVGNVNINGVLNSSSSRGPTADGRIKPEVTAMGTNNYHAVPSEGYSNAGQGTSFSAPMVAGMAAQLLSAYPYLTNEQVRDLILRAGNNYENPNNDVGYGMLSVKRAVNLPNLSNQDGVGKINKMFIASGLNSNENVTINYKRNNDEWNSSQMQSLENFRYTFELPPIFGMGDDISFYFSYTDTSGISMRDPETGNYSLNVTFDSTGDDRRDDLVNIFELEQNYPNPFNNRTSFRIKSTSSGNAKVMIYNVLGQKIKELFSGMIPAGITSLVWDGTDNFGNGVASGPYFYQVIFNNKIETKKMLLLK